MAVVDYHLRLTGCDLRDDEGGRLHTIGSTKKIAIVAIVAIETTKVLFALVASFAIFPINLDDFGAVTIDIDGSVPNGGCGP